MIHQSFPEAAPRAAVHCDDLLKRRAGAADLAPEFEAFGERLALALRSVVASVWNDPAVQVRAMGARPLPAPKLAEACGPLGAASLHAFGSGRQLLLWIEARGLLEQIDRAFGGSGDVGEDLPSELPFSADLLAQRLEQQVMGAVSSELGGLDLLAGRRHTNLAKLSPFSADGEIRLLEIEIAGKEMRSWRMALVAESAALADLLPRRGRPGFSPAPRHAHVGAAPFADLPLPASATLVDMTVPLHRLADLQPGTVLPIAVARSVPLKIGDAVVARGTIGEVDDQVALQITQTFFGKESQ